MTRHPVSCLLVAALCAVGCISTPPPVPQDPGTLLPQTRRETSLGSVVGTAGRYGGHVWRGLPYAKPPVGALRWRAPQPPEPWGALEATDFKSVCPQFASAFGGVNDVPAGRLTGDEDCLGLNVYAPAFAPGDVPVGADRLPVMFWIHGGGNTIGSAGFYDGSRLASEQRVIVVSVNYRLGVLGWLRHPKLNAERDAIERSGNFGTLDLVRGLEWVRDHIGAFGGDPGNVTIFGESAGGHNVFTLLASPLARGLFHRAIVESGGSWESTPARAEHFVDDEIPGDPFSSGELLLHFLQEQGRADDRESAKAVLAEMTPDAVGEMLRGLSLADLFAAYSDGGIGMYRSPRVFLDGTVLPERPVAQVLDDPAHTAQVPVMLGTNRDEEKLFNLFDPHYTTRFFDIVPIFHDIDAFQRDSALASRSWKLSGVDFPAKQLHTTLPDRVFTYRWDWDEEPTLLWLDMGELLGASHGFEIPFVFGHFDLGPQGNIAFSEDNRPGREALSAAMRAYWAAFARDGAPGRGDGSFPEWTAWDPAGDRDMLLDTADGGGLRMTARFETADGIADEILADPSYENEALRCTALAFLADETHTFWGDDGFRKAGGGRCASFDPQALLDSRRQQ